MKTLKTLLMISLAGTLVTACDSSEGAKWSKNPAPDINQIRAAKKTDGKEKAQVVTEYVEKEVPVEVVKTVYVDREVKVEVEKPVYIDKEVPVTVEKIVYVDKEVPVTVEKIVYVDKEVPVTKEQATLDDKYLVITADPAMKFMEGQTGAFKVLGRPLVAGLKVDLNVSGLPTGATFEKVSDGEVATYLLKWSPSVAMIPSSEVYKTFDLKITAQVVEVPQGRNKEAIQKLIREKDVTVFVIRSQKAPAEVTVEGLNQEVSEGQMTPFSIVASVHGVDDKSGDKPTLKISYDQISSIAGSPLLELDGTKHIVADQAQLVPVYMGNYKWKFNLMYDTKNVAVQPALSKDGKLSPNADFTPVRMSFKVVSPFGAESPLILKQLRIKHTTAFAAPKFDMIDLNGEALQLTPGQTAKVSFKVQSPSPGAGTNLNWMNLATLKGPPQMACVTSKEVNTRLECTFTWKVPCDTTDAELTQNIQMTAVAVKNGQNSETTSYVLKTVRSKDKATGCTQSGATP